MMTITPRSRIRGIAIWRAAATSSLILATIGAVIWTGVAPGAIAQEEPLPGLVVTNDGGTFDVSDSRTIIPASIGANAPIAAIPAVDGTPFAEGTPAAVESVSADAAPPAAVESVPADGATTTDVAAPDSASETGDVAASGDPLLDADAAAIVASDSATGSDANNGQGGAERDRKARERKNGNRNASKGNGGVSEVIAEPLSYMHPAALQQEDAADSTAGATGESGTVNGEPRETTSADPGVTTGAGDPLAPAGVMLPPSVPALGIDPVLAAGVGGTTEVAAAAVADTTVFTAAPDSPQTIESEPLLALGGPQGATSLISFDVTGIGEGTVLSALLTFTGAGETGAPGGSVGVIYDYIVPEDVTANGVPGGDSALNVHGVPSWFEEVEPGAITSVDVTGSVYGDGAITFILPGQPETSGSIYSSESGVLPQLVMTVALPG